MSSILSDIFYNPTNTNLIDNYLHHHHTTNNNNTSFTHPSNHPHSLSQIINNNAVDGNAQMYMYSCALSMDMKSQGFTKGKQYRINVSNKNMSILSTYQQTICNTKHHIHVQINTTITINTNNNNNGQSSSSIAPMCIQIYASTGTQIGRCYLPIQNIHNMVDKGIISKVFHLKTVGTTHMNMNMSMVKVEIKVGIDYQNNNSKYTVTNRNGNGNGNMGSFSSLGNHLHKHDESNSWTHTDFFNHSHNNNNNGSNKNKNKNRPALLKVQDKPIKVRVTKYKPHNNNDDDGSRLLFIKHSWNRYKLRQQITIKPNQITQKGINLYLLQQQQQQQNNQVLVGIVHMNAILLLCGRVDGSFPVTNPEDGKCVGVVQVRGGDARNKQQQQYDGQEQQQEQCQSKEQSKQISVIQQTNRPTTNTISGFSIQIVKCILQPPPNDNNNNSMMGLVRLKCPQYKQKVSTYPCKCVYNGQSIQVVMDEQQYMLVYQQCMLDQLSFQLQLHMDKQLIGYYLYDNHNKDNVRQSGIQVQGRLVNMGNNNSRCNSRWVCNAAMNIYTFTIPPNTFPYNKLNTNLKLLSECKYQSIKHNENGHRWVSNKMRQNPTLTYIQCHRVLQLSTILQSDSIYINNNNKHDAIIDSSKIVNEVEYLDSDKKGTVAYSDIVNIADYYHLPLDNINECSYMGDLYYLLYFAQGGIRKIYGKVTAVTKQKQKQKQINIQVDKQQDNSQTIPKTIPIGNNTPSWTITQIICNNMQTLLNNQSIPSLKLHIPTNNYTSKCQYSSASPHFQHLKQQIREGDHIQFMHYSVKMGKDVKVGHIVYRKGEEEYKIGGAIIRVVVN